MNTLERAWRLESSRLRAQSHCALSLSPFELERPCSAKSSMEAREGKESAEGQPGGEMKKQKYGPEKYLKCC